MAVFLRILFSLLIIFRRLNFLSCLLLCWGQEFNVFISVRHIIVLGKLHSIKFRYSEKNTKIWKKIFQHFWRNHITSTKLGDFFKNSWPSQNIWSSTGQCTMVAQGYSRVMYSQYVICIDFKLNNFFQLCINVPTWFWKDKFWKKDRWHSDEVITTDCVTIDAKGQ